MIGELNNFEFIEAGFTGIFNDKRGLGGRGGVEIEEEHEEEIQ